jgi:cytochrome P450
MARRSRRSTTSAIDELLRFDGPVQHTIRVPLVPIELRGADGEPIIVEPGRLVLTVLGAGNHDPAVFDDPHALRLDRPNAAKHLAFSAGSTTASVRRSRSSRPASRSHA